jgi:hypothetical protein
MSKVQSFVCKYVTEFGENIFAFDGRIIFVMYVRLKSTVQSEALYYHTTSEN